MKEKKETTEVLSKKFDGIELFSELDETYENPSPGLFEGLAIIYAVSWDTNYVKFLKRSIVSQIKYTDINLEHLYVVADYTTIDEVKKELNGIILEENIIPVPNNFSIKITALNHYRFDNYKAKFMFDSDLFVFSPNGRYNFYEKMDKYYDYYDTMFFWMEYNWASHELVDRSLNLNGLLHYGEEFIEFYLDNLNEKQRYTFHDGLKWKFSGFLGVKNHFKEPEYYHYLMKSLVNAVGCDETVLNIWAHKMDYKTSYVHYLPDTYMQSSVGFKEYLDSYYEQTMKDGLYLIHPFEQKNTIREETVQFINDILI